MTLNQKKYQLLKNMIGYKTDPVDIETFLRDPYFLGNTFAPNGNFKVFDGWMKALWETFPNDVTVYPYIAATGAIGLGKTTFFRACQLYTIHRFLCIDDFPNFCDRAQMKAYNWIFCTVRIDSANEFINTMHEAMNLSPYFLDQKAKLGKKGWDSLICLKKASRTTHLISNDCPSILLSEINEANRVDENGDMYAWKLLSESFGRVTSRYRNIIGLFPQLLLDSSAKDADSPMEQFIRDSPFSNKLRVYSYAQWEINSKEKFFMPRIPDQRTCFWIYVGSPEIPAFMLDKEELESQDIPLNADRDLFKKVPIELINEPGNRLEDFIRNVMGISTKAGLTFFNYSAIKHAFSLPQTIKEVIEIDESLDTPIEEYSSIKEVLDSMPTVHPIYIGIDIGTKKDLTGIAIAYIDKWNETLINEDVVYNPHIKVPIVFGLDRKEGQSTSITRIFNFIIYLNTRFKVNMILTDGYGSVEMLQNLIYKQLEAKTYSVESQLEYSIFKNIMFDNLVEMPDNSLLKAELLCLRQDPKKPANLNHPLNGNPQKDETTGKFISAVSKDLADATCRAVLGAYQYGRTAKDGMPIMGDQVMYDMLEDMYAELHRDAHYNRALNDINNMFN